MKNYKLFIILGFVLFFFWMTFGSNSGVKIKPRDSPPTFIPVRPSSDISLTYNPVRTLRTHEDNKSDVYVAERDLSPDREGPRRTWVPRQLPAYDPHIGWMPLPGTGYVTSDAGISTSDDEFVSDEENLY